jgi:hypothetical protein
MSLSPETASILGDVAVVAGQAIAAGLRAKSDEEAKAAARALLLSAIAKLESAEAHKQFPNLRED